MILFRADGNEVIGSGHIMRCLTIAETVREKEECCFVLADDCFSALVEKRGFPSFCLNRDFANMSAELEVLIPYIKEKRPSAVIVDSYYATKKYLREIRKYLPVLYIDDLGGTAYPVDALVNYNIYGPEMDYAGLYRKEGREIPKLLLGVSYVPLRREFQNIKKRLQPKKVKNIFISTGGADSEHVALKLAQYLCLNHNYQKYKYHFLLGALNQDVPKLVDIAEKYPDFIELHHDVKQVGKLIQMCDIAVSAAGSTLYELCACGIPTIIYVLADNQIQGAHAFEKRNLMVYAGDVRNNDGIFENILNDIIQLCGDYYERQKMSKKMRSLVDGNGTKRIVRGIFDFIQEV